MTGQVVALLRDAVRAAGLAQPDIRRAVAEPGLLLVHARPVTLEQWPTWLDLVDADPHAETNRGGDAVYVHGRFRGCRVHLIGHGVPRLRYEARITAGEDLPPFGTPIT